MTERREAPKTLPGWIWGGLIGCAIVMSWMGWNSRKANHKFQAIFGGNANLKCVENSGRLYATRLGPIAGVNAPQRIEDFEAIAEPIEVSADLSRRLQKVLTSPSSYYLGDEKHSCAPRYGFRLRFICNNVPLEAWICLECGLVAFVSEGKAVGGGMLVHGEREMKELSRELFPGDPGIEEAAK
jgi:hypothetical protein